MNEMARPEFSLITLSYQSGTHLSDCLEALTGLGDNNEYLHADNGSDDISLADLKARFPGVIQIANPENLGFAAGMNQAAARARGTWLGFINPDAFVDRNWLKAMQRAIEDHPDTAIFTSLQLDSQVPDHMDGAGDAMTFFGFPYRSGFGQNLPETLKTSEVFGPCGAAFLIRRDLFLALDGFDESFFCYCEDADLAFRARLLGARTLFIPQAIVHHVGSASSGKRSDFALWHGYRNRIWLYIKNMPALLLVVSAPFHFAMTLFGALKDTFKGKGHIVGSALLAALLGIKPMLLQRKIIQSRRQISALRLAKSLTWNPLKIARRDLDHRRP